MGHVDATNEATFAAGFMLARQLRNPELRMTLKSLGWTSGQHIVVALDSEPVVDVVARLTFHDTAGRAFLAIPDKSEPFGFLMILVEVVTSDSPPPPDPVPLGPGASIGMVCDLLEPAGTYVPSEWSHALLFERVPA